MNPQSSSITKWALSLGFIAATVGYALWNYADTEQVTVAPATPPTNQQPTSAQTAAATTATTPAAPPAPVPVPAVQKTGFVDGSYTGNATDAYYGIVQVKAIVTGGRLADVQFLQYPNDRGTSREINLQAMPMLAQEAIQAQSAQVNIISGATQTSEGFQTSLASALAQAK